jgi:hypothetical protein
MRGGALLIVALLVLLPGAAHARRGCAPGRFAVRGPALIDPSVPDGTDEVLLLAKSVLVQSGCPSTRMRVRPKKRFTLVRARWASCGTAGGPLRLEARIDAETCATMEGALVWKKKRARKSFLAYRQVAGGVVGGTFKAIQDRIFTARGCTVSTCHGALPAAGLDLRPGAAYPSLVDVAAANPTARADGALRVTPGDPEASLLSRKLHGRLLFGEGAMMPLLGRPLNALELEVVDAWIRAGAPPTGRVVGAPAFPPLVYEPTAPLPPPPGGYQLVLEGPTLQPGEEQEGCLWVEAPNADDVPIGSFEIALNPGTHHFAIWVWEKAQAPTTGVWNRNDIACLSGATFGGGVLGQGVAGSGQAPYTFASFPPGVAGVLPGKRYFGLNAHYYNEFDVPVQIRVWANFFPYEGTPAHIAKGITSLDSTFGIRVAPFTRKVHRGRFVNQSAQTMAIFGLGGHMHKRGVRFSAWDSAGTHLFDDFDFAHPVGRPFDPPMQLAPGDYIDYECLHDNGVERPVRRTAADEPTALVFGISAEDEMCILTGSYY